MNQRYRLTEDEHIQFVELGDAWWLAFSKLIGEAVSQVDPEIRANFVDYLEDHASVHGSRYQDFIVKEGDELPCASPASGRSDGTHSPTDA